MGGVLVSEWLVRRWFTRYVDIGKDCRVVSVGIVGR